MPDHIPGPAPAVAGVPRDLLDILDAARYRVLRDHPDADVRIVGVGKRSGAELDAVLDRMGIEAPEAKHSQPSAQART